MAYILIDRSNFYHNLDQLAKKAGGANRLAVVLKDNAYGHGLRLMGELSRDYGIKEAVVFSDDEAQNLSDLFEHILVLGGQPKPSFKLSYAISQIELLHRIDPRVLIELKVDTGMHRNGIEMERLGEALKIIRRRKLNLFGVMTHFRSADELNSEYFWQKKRFDRVKRDVISAGFKDTRFHSHNSAALLRSKNFDESIARVGIAIYGYNPLPAAFERLELLPVLSLWARRVSTRGLKAGERIGYGGQYTTKRPMVVSTYDLGYGDGWPRGDAAQPYKIANGRAILGRVSMDFISVEGEQESICVMEDASRAAKHFGTICYEMTTALMPTIPRILKEDFET